MYRILNTFFLPILVLISIWLPVVQPYILYKKISNQEQVESINFPNNKVASEIDDLDFGVTSPHLDTEELLYAANAILMGRIDLPGCPRLEINLPFDQKLINASNSSWQLSYSGFIVPEILILAYDQSGNVEYLKAARNFILGWADFEKTQFLPIGFLWNDHALASRASVISSFWSRYKNNAIYNINDSEKILQLVCRTADILANDNLYTYKTNHGVMQNLALFRLTTYFPLLPDMPKHKNKAISRLLDQFNYYINEEGFVTEHSAGYHESGVNLFKTMIILFKINNIEMPAILSDKYRKSVDILSKLYRPDRTMPALGDTNVGRKSILFGNINANNEKLDKYVTIDETLLMKSGYSIWWAGNSINERLSQTVINWSYYTYTGHKHADELSVNIWGYGQNWITNVGYWPYTSPDRENAISWIGSNAPHYISENSQSKRISKILNIGREKKINFIELIREESSGFNINRQVIQFGSNLWFVIDSFSDKKPNRTAEVVWTLDASLNIKELSDNSFEITPKDSSDRMVMEFKLSDNLPIKTYYGDKATLFGWNASGQQIKPAYSFLVNLPSNNSWSLMTAIIEPYKSALPVNVKEWINSENWTITQEDSLIISRRGREMSITDNLEKQYIFLQPIDFELQKDSENYNAFLKVKNKFGKPFRPLIEYREKVSKLVILFVVLLIFYYIKKRKSNQFDKFISFGWVALMIWLNQYYFYV